MKILYLECSMGAAGDMFTSALLELISDREGFADRINSLGLPGVQVTYERAGSCGVFGTRTTVKIHGKEEHSHDANTHHHDHDHHEHHYDHSHGHHHHHTTLEDVRNIISHLDIPEKVKNDAQAVYALIAEAESHAHDKPLDQIHFHEVGTLDAVADVVSVCLLMDILSPDRIIASPVCTGFGHVHCAHGVLPVPAPATAYILQGVPAYSGDIEAELCTPTGAALLKHFCTEFCTMPVMMTDAVGIGLGKKEFERLNCVRAFVGSTDESSEDIYELSCNLDDMTGEDIAYACTVLTQSGALDVFTTPVSMKKNRPGVMLTVLCKEQDRQKMAGAIFAHTTTIGIREHKCSRYTLHRKESTVTTVYGDVRVKISEGYGVKRIKPEHDDLERLARENGVTVAQIRKMI